MRKRRGRGRPLKGEGEKVVMMRTASERSDEDFALLRKIENRDGLVKPEAVVEEARNEDHPWHSRFEWEDSVAAERYRLEQARTLIRLVKTRIVSETVVTYVPRFVANPEPAAPQGYRSTIKVAPQRDMSMAVLNDELQRIKGCVNRGRALAIQFGLEAEFELMLQNVVAIEAKLKAAA